MDDVGSRYQSYISRLNEALQSVSSEDLSRLMRLLLKAKQDQSGVFIVGNGGNASTASHWATDLGKGLRRKTGAGLKSMSLTDNAAWVTAVANDIAFDQIFADQLKAHGKKGDLLICLSASGESENILEAIDQARLMGVYTISVTGFDGGRVKNTSDHFIHINTAKGEYGVVEDIQLILNHFICDFLAE